MRVDDLNKPLGYAPRAHQEAQHAPMPARMPMPLRDMPWGGLALCGIGLIAASLVAFTYVTERAATPPAPALAANVDYAPPRRISVPDFSSAASSLSEADSIVSVSPGVRILSTASDQDSQVKSTERGTTQALLGIPSEAAEFHHRDTGDNSRAQLES
jgi:hypothetical protein